VNVAVFGGSFNPPHVAHVLACTLLLSVERVDSILVVPAYKHPFAKSLAPFQNRVAMCELAMGWIPGVQISKVEEEMGGESRTLRTLEHLAQEHPEWALRLVIGADILAEAPRWFGFDAIGKIAPPIVLGRAGFDGPEPAFLPDVSSTQVRAAVARGDWTVVEKLVPRNVVTYIRDAELYR
jgi:nicotinate-nucleotide adenylyltransferase